MSGWAFSGCFMKFFYFFYRVLVPDIFVRASNQLFCLHESLVSVAPDATTTSPSATTTQTTTAGTSTAPSITTTATKPILSSSTSTTTAESPTTTTTTTPLPTTQTDKQTTVVFTTANDATEGTTTCLRTVFKLYPWASERGALAPSPGFWNFQ